MDADGPADLVREAPPASIGPAPDWMSAILDGAIAPGGVLGDFHMPRGVGIVDGTQRLENSFDEEGFNTLMALGTMAAPLAGPAAGLGARATMPVPRPRPGAGIHGQPQYPTPSLAPESGVLSRAPSSVSMAELPTSPMKALPRPMNPQGAASRGPANPSLGPTPGAFEPTMSGLPPPTATTPPTRPPTGFLPSVPRPGTLPIPSPSMPPTIPPTGYMGPRPGSLAAPSPSMPPTVPPTDFMRAAPRPGTLPAPTTTSPPTIPAGQGPTMPPSPAMAPRPMSLAPPTPTSPPTMPGGQGQTIIPQAPQAPAPRPFGRMPTQQQAIPGGMQVNSEFGMTQQAPLAENLAAVRAAGLAPTPEVPLPSFFPTQAPAGVPRPLSVPQMAPQPSAGLPQVPELSQRLGFQIQGPTVGADDLANLPVEAINARLGIRQFTPPSEGITGSMRAPPLRNPIPPAPFNPGPNFGPPGMPGQLAPSLPPPESLISNFNQLPDAARLQLLRAALTGAGAGAGMGAGAYFGYNMGQ